MRELGLRVEDVLHIIEGADVIERYTDRKGVLLYGQAGALELHVSLVRAPASDVTLVTTVYEVDRGIFPDGRTRRSAP